MLGISIERAQMLFSITKCSCHRKPPRCEYCRKVSRENGRKAYRTEVRRERAKRERARGKKYERRKSRPEDFERLDKIFQLNEKLDRLRRLLR